MRVNSRNRKTEYRNAVFGRSWSEQCKIRNRSQSFERVRGQLQVVFLYSPEADTSNERERGTEADDFRDRLCPALEFLGKWRIGGLFAAHGLDHMATENKGRESFEQCLFAV